MPEINITKLKKDIESAKEQKARAEGQMEQIIETWKKDYGCSTIEEVREYTADMEKKVQALREKYADIISKIEKILNDQRN